MKYLCTFCAVLSLTAAAHTAYGEGDPQRGEKLYQTCVACHGKNGQGNPALQAPQLAGQYPWYTATQLKNFQNGVRGADAKNDPKGAMMRPMAENLESEQDIEDVAAYIATLEPKRHN